MPQHQDAGGFSPLLDTLEVDFPNPLSFLDIIRLFSAYISEHEQYRVADSGQHVGYVIKGNFLALPYMELHRFRECLTPVAETTIC